MPIINHEAIKNLGADKRVNNNASHLKKAPGKKKQAITIYEIGEDIAALGGMGAVRSILKKCFKDIKENLEAYEEWSTRGK